MNSSGFGFGDSAEDMTVTIGGVACDVTYTNFSQFTCTVGNSPAGNHPILVNVFPWGKKL